MIKRSGLALNVLLFLWVLGDFLLLILWGLQSRTVCLLGSKALRIPDTVQAEQTAWEHSHRTYPLPKECVVQLKKAFMKFHKFQVVPPGMINALRS